MARPARWWRRVGALWILCATGLTGTAPGQAAAEAAGAWRASETAAPLQRRAAAASRQDFDPDAAGPSCSRGGKVAEHQEVTGDSQLATVRLVTPLVATRPSAPASIEYLLSEEAPSVTIEILDAAGRVMRRFTSHASDEANPEPMVSGEDGRTLGSPTRRKGRNRFVWDLRLAGPTPIPESALRDESAVTGPFAMPGTYQVRVSALGQTATAACEVRLDPALTNTALADLQAQHDLAVRVRDRLSEANEAFLRISNLETQIASRIPQARSPVIALAADATLRVLGEVADGLASVPSRRPRAVSHGTPPVSARLAALLSRLLASDAAPTPEMGAHFEELSAELDTLLGRLRSVEANHLAAFNRLLSNAGLQPVEAGDAAARQP